MLEFGLRRGMAVPIVKDRSQEIMQGYALKKHAQNEAAAKAKLFADDFDYNNAINAYDNPKVKAYAQSKIKEVGTFIRENPDWERNVDKRMQYKQMIRELKDNPDLNRGLQSDASRKQWNEWAVKNPELANSPEGKLWNDGWNNYIQYGHQEGEQGLKRDGGPRPFTFVPPELFDDEKYIEERFKNLPTRDRHLTSQEFGSQVGAGAIVSDVDINRARVEAQSILRDQVSGYRMQARWKQLTPAEQSFYNNNIVEWIAQRGINHTKKEFKPGQYHFDDSGSGKGGGGYSPFLNDFGNLRKGEVTFSNNTDAISPVVNGKLSTASPLRVMTKDAQGNASFITLDGYKGQDLKAYNTGKIMVGPSGEMLTEVKVTAPITKELVYGKNPLFKSDSFFEGTWDPDSNTEEIKGYDDVARLDIGEDGKPNGFAQLTVLVPANTSESAVRTYDKIASGQANTNIMEGSAINTINSRNNIINSNNNRISQNSYLDVRVNPKTGEQIGYDGKQWRNVKTGQPL